MTIETIMPMLALGLFCCAIWFGAFIVALLVGKTRLDGSGRFKEYKVVKLTQRVGLIGGGVLAVLSYIIILQYLATL